MKVFLYVLCLLAGMYFMGTHLSLFSQPERVASSPLPMPSQGFLEAPRSTIHESHSVSRPAPAPSTKLTEKEHMIQFNDQLLKPTTDPVTSLASWQQELPLGSYAPALLGFSKHPHQRLKIQLQQQGIELLSYVPDGGWIARVHQLSEPPAVEHLTHFYPLENALKISPHFESPDLPPEVSVYLHLLPGSNETDLQDQLKQKGFSKLTAQHTGPYTYLSGKILVEELGLFIDQVGKHRDVQFLEPGTHAQLLNATAKKTVQSGTYNGTTPFFDQGIYGSNQVLAVLDTGIDADSCYYRNVGGILPPTNNLYGTNVNLSLRKLVACNFLYDGDDPNDPTDWDNHRHGTRVSGHALGANIDNPIGGVHNGMAPGAKLIMQDGGFSGADDCADLVGLGCPVTNFYPALVQAVAQGATIHNNSWGDREEFFPQNLYTLPCRELDLVSWSNKQFLVVCAAGNSAYRGLDTVGSPSISKNALSVGASIDGPSQESIAGFSSRGWASDGRIKPDICAPGQGVTSSSSDLNISTDNCTASTGSGTSYSSPIVAGMAALVRDYFAQGFYPSKAPSPSNEIHAVSAALVKGILIQSGVNMGNVATLPPSRVQGWGRVNLSTALPFTNSTYSLYVVDAPPLFNATPSLPYRTYVNVLSTNEPIEVTLTWTDYPATAGATKHLINDLDLRVKTPDSLTYKGNHFETNGWSITGGIYDRTNNVERVYFQPGVTGIVELSVWAHVIAVPGQDFALVCTGDIEAYPSERDDDADSLPDYWELMHMGNLSATALEDPDSDGAPNYTEWGAHTDPLDGSDALIFHIQRTSNNVPVLEFDYREARQYQIQYSTSLSSTGTNLFMPVPEQVEGEGMRTTGTPEEAGTHRYEPAPSAWTNNLRTFYRLEVTP